MAAAYNHRVHMEPNDMPAMHLCMVGEGVNGLGYYMCDITGGFHADATIGIMVETTPTRLFTLPTWMLPTPLCKRALSRYASSPIPTQSRQPAGAQNPMPSMSYDFFAPLGEFGQVRPHFHKYG